MKITIGVIYQSLFFCAAIALKQSVVFNFSFRINKLSLYQQKRNKVMKKLIILALFGLSMCLNVKAQTYEKSEIEILDSTYKKADIYSKCLEWTGKAFKSAQNVIQVSDKNAGKIIIKGLLNSSPRSGMYGDLSKGTYCTIDITIKDGKYKIIIKWKIRKILE